MAPANVNANDTSPVPLPVDILKKEEHKKSTRFLLLSRIPEFIYECIQNTERENKVEREQESTGRAAKVYGWYEELFFMTTPN